MICMTLRNFTPDEIAEINNYVLNQIPQTILPSLFIITEEPIKKLRSFIAIYRVLQSCRDFIENDETRQKLNEHLKKSKDAYKETYEILVNFDTSLLEIEKDYYEKKIKRLVQEYNNDINYCVNTFLVFAEKMELISTNTVSGIKMDKEFGQELYENISKNVED